MLSSQVVAGMGMRNLIIFDNWLLPPTSLWWGAVEWLPQQRYEGIPLYPSYSVKTEDSLCSLMAKLNLCKGSLMHCLVHYGTNQILGLFCFVFVVLALDKSRVRNFIITTLPAVWTMVTCPSQLELWPVYGHRSLISNCWYRWGNLQHWWEAMAVFKRDPSSLLCTQFSLDTSLLAGEAKLLKVMVLL